VGGVWSERVEGTNGIGTCITDRRPVLVHCAEHFRSRHTRLSCAAAPMFDPHGGLLGVPDVSKVHQQSDDQPFGGDQAARKLFALSDESFGDGIPLSATFAFDHCGTPDECPW